MNPKISIYSTAWNILAYKFDYEGALDNWAKYADEIVIAINNCRDSYFYIETYASKKNYPVKLVWTEISPEDPFMYGKILNSALQVCTGDLLIQQDLDERLRIDKKLIPKLYNMMKENFAQALFIPTIDLYGNEKSFVNIGAKWYMHLPGLQRGAVKFGIKENGRPDYNKTSSDELLDNNGDLVSTIRLLSDNSIESVRKYVNRGMPMVYHLGFLNLNDRAERAKWWKAFWENATGGDKNSHITDPNELLKRETKEHGLPLWTT